MSVNEFKNKFPVEKGGQCRKQKPTLTHSERRDQDEDIKTNLSLPAVKAMDEFEERLDRYQKL